MIWAVRDGAAARIEAYRCGPRSLIAAATAAGHEVLVLDRGSWASRASLLPPSETALYAGHPCLDEAVRVAPALRAGAFHDPERYGHEALVRAVGGVALNASAKVTSRDELARIVRSGRKVFARPEMSDKAFAGRVFGPEDAERVGALPDVRVIVSEPAEIVAEYRFVILNGEPVTGSQYRRSGVPDVRIDTDPACAALARATGVDGPDEIYVCDVAQTPEGPRIIERNGFSASGLYMCDCRVFVEDMPAVVAARHAERETECLI